MSRLRLLLIFSCAVLSGLLAAAGQAHEIVYAATLSGPDESPSNNSPGTGSATVTVDFDRFTMRVEVTFSALQGTVTASHIHAATPTPLAGTAGVATQTPSFEMFPMGVTSGTYDRTFDLTLASSYNPDFIAANGGTISTASNALFIALAQRKSYLNIHSSAFAGGEIRGFLLGPQIAITQVAAMPSGEQIAIVVAGTVDVPGADVFLEQSVDLQHWQNVTTTVADADSGAFTFNTAVPRTTLSTFYRAIGSVGAEERD